MCLRLPLTWTARHSAHMFTSKEKHDDAQQLHRMSMGSTSLTGMQSWNGLWKMVSEFNLWNVYWYPCLHLAPAQTLVWGLSGLLGLEQQNVLVFQNNLNSDEKTALVALVSYLHAKAQRFEKWDLWNKVLRNHTQWESLFTPGCFIGISFLSVHWDIEGRNISLYLVKTSSSE